MIGSKMSTCSTCCGGVGMLPLGIGRDCHQLGIGGGSSGGGE